MSIRLPNNPKCTVQPMPEHLFSPNPTSIFLVLLSKIIYTQDSGIHQQCNK